MQFSVRNTIESAHIRFDENVGARADLSAGEEFDIIIRLITTRSVGFYDPTLIICHPIERQSDNRSELHEIYEMAYGYVIGKHVGVLALTQGALTYAGSAGYLASAQTWLAIAFCIVVRKNLRAVSA